MQAINLKDYSWPDESQKKFLLSNSGKKKNNFSIIKLLNKDINLFSNSFPIRKKETFFSELGKLLGAGVDVKTCFDLIIDGQKKEKDREEFIQIKDAILEGASLSKSLQNSGKFNSYDIYTIQIGEETGRLSYVLTELGKFYSKQITQRRKVVSAITYPAIVMITAIGAVYFMLGFLVPMFADVFKRVDSELPMITQLIIDISTWISGNMYVLIILAFLATLFILLQRKKTYFRKVSSSIILKTPLVNDMIRKIYVGRFLNTISLLLSSQVSLLRSLELAKEMIGYYPIESSIDRIKQNITNGMSLNQSMAEFSIYNKKIISMVKLGEEINRLPEFMDKIAQQYNEEVDHEMNVLGTVLEPALIIFLGLMVGIILIAMYLPLFQLSTSIM